MLRVLALSYIKKEREKTPNLGAPWARTDCVGASFVLRHVFPGVFLSARECICSTPWTQQGRRHLCFAWIQLVHRLRRGVSARCQAQQENRSPNHFHTSGAESPLTFGTHDRPCAWCPNFQPLRCALSSHSRVQGLVGWQV